MKTIGRWWKIEKKIKQIQAENYCRIIYFELVYI